MKIAIWVLFAVTATLWTGFAFVSTEALGWAATAMGQVSGGGSWADLVSNWSVPTWLLVWVDARDVQALQLGLATALEFLQKAWPDMGSAFQWLVPAIWVFWFLGLLVLLLLAGLGHWMVSKSAGTRQSALPTQAS